jgi:cell fate regulator YaaT (PSP1 superfamily)
MMEMKNLGGIDLCGRHACQPDDASKRKRA